MMGKLVNGKGRGKTASSHFPTGIVYILVIYGRAVIFVIDEVRRIISA